MSTTVSHEASSHNLPIPCACHESFRVHTSNAHKVLRLPRNVTSVTPRNLTIPCACHENRTSTPQKPHKVLRLPRKMTISSHVSFKKICTTTHVWNDFDPFWAHSHPPKSAFQLRLVTKTELRCHTLKRKSQWHGHIQHPKSTTLQTLIPMELRSTLQISQNAAPAQRNASRVLRHIPFSCKSQWNSGANWHVTHPWKVTCKSFPQWQRLSDLLRTVADGCEHRSNGSRTRLYPQTPKS